MPAASRLGAQIEEIVTTLNAMGARFALIGGLALASYKVLRGTSDVDLLTDAKATDSIHEEMLRLGYQCLYRSPEVANYRRGDQRVDFLFASRPVAQRLLAGASEKGTSFGPLPVISVDRPRDLIAAEGGVTVPIESARDPYERLDDLMVVIEALCPRYPEREPFTGSEVFRL